LLWTARNYTGARGCARNREQFPTPSGNGATDNDATPFWPCNASIQLTNVVCVGATTNTGALTYFSNWGRASVDLFAPGVGVVTDFPSNGFASVALIDGTSAAAPFVSGAAALLLSANPSLSASQMKANPSSVLRGQRPGLPRYPSAVATLMSRRL
jgi:subtilisin family serine protease